MDRTTNLATLLLSLIDHLKELVRAGRLRRRECFEKIVEPLYMQFLPLGIDMLDLFRTARRGLPNMEVLSNGAREWGSNLVGCYDPELRQSLQQRATSQSLLQELTRRREAYLDARTSLRAMLAACEKEFLEQGAEDLTCFVQSVLLFFVPSPHLCGTRSRRLVELFSDDAAALPVWQKQLGKAFQSLPDRAAFIEKMTSDMERSWYAISHRYQQLKIEYTAGS